GPGQGSGGPGSVGPTAAGAARAVLLVVSRAPASPLSRGSRTLAADMAVLPVVAGQGCWQRLRLLGDRLLRWLGDGARVGAAGVELPVALPAQGELGRDPGLLGRQDALLGDHPDGPDADAGVKWA